MEDYSRNSAFMHQLTELVNDCELYVKRESRDTQVKSSPSQCGFRANHFMPFGCSSSGNYSDHSDSASQYPENHDYVQSFCNPVYPNPSYDSQNQQNFYPQDHYHVSDFDQSHSYYPQYQNPYSVPFNQNPACYDASYDFQYQEPISEPNSFAYTQYQQETRTLEHDQWNYYDSEPSPMQEATTATFQISDLEAMLQSYYDSTDAKFQWLEESLKRMEEQFEQFEQSKQSLECQVEADFRDEVKESDISNDSSCVLRSCVGTLAEDNEEEEENQPTMVENEQELVQEEEKQREPEFYANQFFISDDGKEANVNVLHENSCILDDADSFYDEESSIEELDYFEELEKNQISSLQEKQTEEVSAPCLQSEVDQEAQQKEAEEKRIAATMKSVVEQDIPFPAALKRTKQQREEEAKKKKLEEEKLLSLLLIRKKEEETETEKLSINLFSMFEEPDSCEENFRESKEQKQGDIEPNDGNGAELKLFSENFVSLTSFAETKAYDEEELEEQTDESSIEAKQEEVSLHEEQNEEEQNDEKELEEIHYSSLLSRIAAKAIEDFTLEDFDSLLHEESEEMVDSWRMGVEHQLSTEKKEEEAPVPEINKASEPFEPQITSPVLKEEETVEFIISEPAPSDFKLTPNLFFLVVNVMISGGKAQSKQLNLRICYKLHLPCLYGEVFMKGANGDGVLWNIKVNPP